MSRNSSPPRPAVAPPAGTMSAPRLQPFTLVASGTQIWTRNPWGWDPHTRTFREGWVTVRRIQPCDRHDTQACVRFLLANPDPGSAVPVADGPHHADLAVEVWMRHPVGGAR